ncbi:MAG: methylmalonyl-CoA epimerase [Candidatus Sericytochromatia bacterium]|nr:MAG: methylmalonyl-CoA epimerase [Candidatus Sericytochromatia bacterium]
MKAKKIDHIAIAVKNLDESLKFYKDLLGLEFECIEIVEEQKVKTAFIKVGDTHIELLEPTSNESTVYKFLEKKGEGLHHIAIKVDNIEEYLSNLDNNNVNLIDKEPKIGAKNKKIAFIHPKSTSGVLLEICEEINKSVYPIL